MNIAWDIENPTDDSKEDKYINYGRTQYRLFYSDLTENFEIGKILRKN